MKLCDQQLLFVCRCSVRHEGFHRLGDLGHQRILERTTQRLYRISEVGGCFDSSRTFGFVVKGSDDGFAAFHQLGANITDKGFRAFLNNFFKLFELLGRQVDVKALDEIYSTALKIRLGGDNLDVLFFLWV